MTFYTSVVPTSLQSPELKGLRKPDNPIYNVTHLATKIRCDNTVLFTRNVTVLDSL